MKCRRCRRPAVFEAKAHNAAFCKDCFFLFFQKQVLKSIRQHHMISAGDRVLVCVSGGKDSLVLWDQLLELGYQADGLHVDLGIGDYSDLSREKAIRFARDKDRPLRVVDLRKEGIPIPLAANRIKRKACSLCGIIKRYYFNRVAVEMDYDVVATGHNLDDEAARLLGNILRWQLDYLARQSPVLQSRPPDLRKKIQPLCRLMERETAAYAFMKGIDYILDECPLSEGATSLTYKRTLNALEAEIPGTKGSFFQGFLRYSRIFKKGPQEEARPLQAACSVCHAPSLMNPCNVCRIKQRMLEDDS